jgi:hypothetical protein
VPGCCDRVTRATIGMLYIASERRRLLLRWGRSSTKTRLLAKGEQVMSTANVRRVSGLETWFELPGRTAPAPPRWKMFVVTAVVIFVLWLCLSVVLPRGTVCVAGSPRRVHRDRRYVADELFV